ncbi:hypothetical protein Tco_1259364, partial [Tanacetum coccineum]
MECQAPDAADPILRKNGAFHCPDSQGYFGYQCQAASNKREKMPFALVIHSSDEEPLARKLKVVLEDYSIPSLTPLNSVSDKGKGIAQTSEDDQLKQLMPLMEEGGSTPKLSNLHQFRTAIEGLLTLEEAKLQMQEIKRLAKLKAKKEKSEKKLKKVLTPEQRKAQEEELAASEAKRAKMIEEYKHCITFTDDPLPITKFSYRVNNFIKEATMRIVRNNHPFNLIVYEKFILKKLAFIEWLELHALASKAQTKSNDQLLKNLKAKF